mmetsp:Transcript_6837/g.14089  ORF Transcript_6837/g.14089 Transcript_6837/m.14089 type:complete len:147 (-) Transcript_6837:78-518(-)
MALRATAGWLAPSQPASAAAPKIEDGLVMWARAQRRSRQGRAVQWTRWTEKELLRLEAVARSQVSKLVPLLDSAHVRERLVCDGLVERDSAFVSSAEDLGRITLAQLLHARAAWIVGEDPAGDDLRSEEEFEKFMTHHCGNGTGST